MFPSGRKLVFKNKHFWLSVPNSDLRTLIELHGGKVVPFITTETDYAVELDGQSGSACLRLCKNVSIHWVIACIEHEGLLPLSSCPTFTPLKFGSNVFATSFAGVTVTPFQIDALGKQSLQRMCRLTGAAYA